ncbi:BQ2448_7202 [Microbotryum intermedium]|uniref:BQ2448_7202 protein n=1 Tax=Microbotryum intermedium TaxID=269621 RepID=A0A238FQA6_9BASI|nr:BQ2448_7202 [Microbotryum intermedium]
MASPVRPSNIDFDPLLTPSASHSGSPSPSRPAVNADHHESLPSSAALRSITGPTTPMSFKKRSAPPPPGPAARVTEELLNLLSSSPKEPTAPNPIDHIHEGHAELRGVDELPDAPVSKGGKLARPNHIDVPPPGPYRTFSANSNTLDSAQDNEDEVAGRQGSSTRGLLVNGDDENEDESDDPSRRGSPHRGKTSVSGSTYGTRNRLSTTTNQWKTGRHSFGAASAAQGRPGFTSRNDQQRLRDPLLSPSDDGRSNRGTFGRGGGLGSLGAEAEEEDPVEKEPTPLPKIALTVLCICMFGEFLSASLSSPFLYFMIEGFGVGQGPEGGGEAVVGFWTGVVSSVFFLSQFLTSLLWVSVAEKHGRRAVLFTSLLGNGVTLMLFGTSKNLGTAISVRLGMGLFNGKFTRCAVGVARSAVQAITDSSNESQAFTYMGLSWGLGGIVGSIIGGLAENPVRNHPRFFGDSVLFKEYPYLLPCLIAGSVTTSGAILSLCLDRDGGPRSASITLPSEKDVERAARSFTSIAKGFVRRFISTVRGQGQPIRLDETTTERESSVSLQTSPVHAQREPLLSPIGLGSNYQSNGMLSPSIAATDDRQVPTARRASNRFSGSAYGYGRLGPGSETGASGMRMPSARRPTGRSGYRAMSVATTNAYAPDYDFDRGDFSFAQRLLMANEQAVFSISDLWVANATREADDQYSQVEYEESVFEDEESRIGTTGTHAGRTNASRVAGDDESRLDVDDSRFSLSAEPDFFGYGTAPPSMEDLRGHARLQELQQGRNGMISPSTESLALPCQARPRDRSVSRATMLDRYASPNRASSYGGGLTQRYRRGSMASSTAPGRGAPSIFANTGLDDETLVQSTQYAPPPGSLGGKAGDDYGAGGGGGFDPMAPIPEGRPASVIEHDEEGDSDSLEIKADTTGLLRQLPLSMIAQYSLLALHGCTCDQIFLSFLVTPVPSGGLGLQASNYAMLVACMFFFTMIWQFRLYPFVGPPHGSLSHLAMFRLGLILYIPVYVLFPELRGLLRESSNSFVMFGMVLLSSLRYLANTCSYTAVMVLVNAMSPPHLTPLANGLAQSCVSFARFIGPLMGGAIWAASISEGPNAHPWPFNYAFPFICIATICFMGFLHSLRIH